SSACRACAPWSTRRPTCRTTTWIFPRRRTSMTTSCSRTTTSMRPTRIIASSSWMLTC
ncbi:hypothetical protein EV175_006826, partial [Coemansia sp. RSA 1933]